LDECPLFSSDPLTCGGPAKGACIFQAQTVNDASNNAIQATVQDLGLCTKIGTKDSDCNMVDGWFLENTNLGKLCALATPCNAPADCTGAFTCQTVPNVGKFCLDHPLAL
jgi:hypothetical protein